MKMHSLPAAQACPTCGRENDAVSNFDNERAPTAGDFSLCIHCQGLHVFDGSLQLRHPTESDLATVPLDAVSRYQAAMTAARKAGQ